MNICFWLFTFLARCARAIFSWNVVVFVEGGGFGGPFFFVLSSSVVAEGAAAFLCVLSFLLLVLKDVDILLIMESKGG